MTTLQEMLARQRGRRGGLGSGPRQPSQRGRAWWTLGQSGPATLRIVILTYNRPDDLLRLLRDIDTYRWGHKISVVVYDDASTKDYAQSKALCAARRWQFVRAEKNHGKRGFWKWVHRIYGEQRARSEGLFCLLPDDMRLCSRFFDKAMAVWSGIKDSKKVALNLLRDSGREGKSSWTDRLPTDVGCALSVGWVDGAILCNRRYFELLEWRVNSVPESRWAQNENMSSGVGQDLSRRLLARGGEVYCVKRSLLAHIGRVSQMNPVERRKNPLEALYFADGQGVHDGLMGQDLVTISMASIPSRVSLLPSVVESVYWQCDRLNVYLNGYASVPKCLQRPRITVARSQEHGDRGDAGKFFWSKGLTGYHFTIDDDLAYPPDYVQKMTRTIDRYGRKAIVGVHGVVLSSRISDSYYDARSTYHCMSSLRRDTSTHVLGTGTVAYHASTIRLSPGVFRRPNMADIWLAIAARRQRVPMVCVSHAQDWLIDLGDPDPSKSIYENRALHDHIQAKALRDAGPWGAPLPLPGVARGNRPQARGGHAVKAPQAIYPNQARLMPRYVGGVRRHSGSASGVQLVTSRNTGVRKKR
jgi:hypothetical protein